MAILYKFNRQLFNLSGSYLPVTLPKIHFLWIMLLPFNSPGRLSFVFYHTSSIPSKYHVQIKFNETWTRYTQSIELG
jgi:hypothetical protein